MRRAASDTGVSGDTVQGFRDISSEIFIVVLVVGGARSFVAVCAAGSSKRRAR
jgi:hypothetical protein